MPPSRLCWLVSLAALPGCALVGVNEKSVKIDTSPPRAMVNLNGLFVGTTPCTISLPRSGGGQLEFEVLPPRDSTERLWTQRRTVLWKKLPNEVVTLYFDLRLEAAMPLQPYEVRVR